MFIDRLEVHNNTMIKHTAHIRVSKSLFRKTKSSWKLMYGLSRYNTLVTNTYKIYDNKCK